ncbi:MAG: metalloregulator ArsR/SmtB family transcription factor [Pseudomonadota bacterium]
MLNPADFFKCLSDETRLRCTTLLHAEGKLCVCELTRALGLSQPKISRHLAQLRQYGLLIDSREGQWVYYRINEGLPHWAQAVLEAAAEETTQRQPYREDRQRLRSMSERPGEAACCA